MLHDVLWRSNLQLAHSCLAHPFVQALGEGTLKADLFRAFIAQDAFFLGAFRKAYALALARSDEVESITSLYELLGGVLEELKLHRAYATELGIGWFTPSVPSAGRNRFSSWTGRIPQFCLTTRLPQLP